MTDPMLIAALVLGLPGGLLLVSGCAVLLLSWSRGRVVPRFVAVSLALGVASALGAGLALNSVASRPHEKTDHEKAMDQKATEALEVDLDLGGLDDLDS
ncbi:MAG: hypothetical protein CMJ75_08365 [Planctomycetaceae bacterium]|nr:hypothetical protein [Planctomycetaceae bacterium]